MARRFALMVLVLATTTFAVTGCDDDEDPLGALRYTVTIVNTTGSDYEVWIDSAEQPTSGFRRDGSVAAGSTREVTNRTIDVLYQFRLVPPGADVETEYAHEKTIVSGADDVTWTVGP